MEVPSFPNMTQSAIPFFILLIAVEIFVLKRGQQGKYELRDSLTSLLMGVGNVIVSIVLGFIAFSTFSLVYEYRIFTFTFEWWAVLICFVIDDFRFYWYHRFAHEVRWLWAAHVNHHSSQHYNLSTALRQPWTSVFTGAFLFRVPLAFIGIHPAVLAFVGGANLVYQFWIHTEAIKKMPRWFEFIMNTPSHHRVHHASNPRYLDANYAGTLIIWDRMFGTFVPEQEEEKVRFGLTTDLNTFNPVKVAIHEHVAIFKDMFQGGISLKDRFRYAFDRPGFSHDGSRKTSIEQKKTYVKFNPDQAEKPGLVV